MALIAVAADKGAPGVTTTCVALAAVWPRPVLLAECDPSGGDLVYRFPAAGGGQLDPQRGLLSLAVATRHGAGPSEVWAHSQKLNGGLDLLAGVVTAEHGAGLDSLWAPVGSALAQLPEADVIADCGRLGADGPAYGLLAEASLVLLVTRASLGEVVRLRERAATLRTALDQRDRAPALGVVVIADHRRFHTAVAEIRAALNTDNGGTGPGRSQAKVLGGLAFEPGSAQQLRGEWSGRLNRSLLMRTARNLVTQIDVQLPSAAAAAPAGPASAVARRGTVPAPSPATGASGSLPAPGSPARAR